MMEMSGNKAVTSGPIEGTRLSWLLNSGGSRKSCGNLLELPKSLFPKCKYFMGTLNSNLVH